MPPKLDYLSTLSYSSFWGWASEKGTTDLIWIIILIVGLFCQLSNRFLSNFELKSNNEAWIYLYYMYKQNRNTPSYSILLSRVVICQFLDALASLDFKLSVSQWCFSASASTGLSELFLNNLRRSTRFTTTKCDFTLNLLKYYTLG